MLVSKQQESPLVNTKLASLRNKGRIETQEFCKLEMNVPNRGLGSTNMINRLSNIPSDHKTMKTLIKDENNQKASQ